jgi:imidazolonepropionase-like amidohydrolase
MKILVKAGKVIDGTGVDPIENGVILIDGTTIVGVGRQSDIKAESGTEVLDVGNKTVIPGLIDCHTHICYGYYRQWIHEKYIPQEVTKSVLQAVRNAQRCIKAGVLTIRDAGCGHLGIFQFRDAINSGKILGPRILTTGLPIAMTGGHGWKIALEVDGPNETRKAVRDMLRWGADCIKFMATGGAGTQYEEIYQVQMTLDELTAGVEEAKKKNKRTFAHVGNSEGALICVKAGVDSIDHGTILDDNALDTIKKAGAFLVPTLYIYMGIATKGEEAGLSDFTVRKGKWVVDYHRDSFQRAYKKGLKIATGTDLGDERKASFGTLGEGLISEIELMVKYGMTSMDAIKAATYMSACNLGIEKSVGTLEKGKSADLVILDGDPLDNIANLRRVWKVMKEGQIVASS